jgi:hypothetical protein
MQCDLYTSYRLSEKNTAKTVLLGLGWTIHNNGCPEALS